MKNISNHNNWVDDLDYNCWMYYNKGDFTIPLIDDPTSNFVFDNLWVIVHNCSTSAYIHYLLNFDKIICLK